MLLEHMRRIERTRNGNLAVYFNFSKLNDHNRQPHFLRIASRAFDTLINNYEATLYVLYNSDMVLMARDVRMGAIDPIIQKLRSLFNKDPLTTGDTGDDAAVFSSWYDLSDMNDYQRMLGATKRLVVQAARRRKEGLGDTIRSEAMRGAALDPTNLTVIGQRLASVQINDLIKRQTVIDVAPGDTGRPILFREHFFAMAELRRRIAPDINLFASPWLFQFLTEALDKRMLAVIGGSNFAKLRDMISLNLNMSTISTREFKRFHENAGPYASKIVIEMQMIDIFSDMPGYARTCAWLQKEGYRVLIDGLSPLALQLFDVSLLNLDFVKINWSSELTSGDSPETREILLDTITKTDKDKIILGRVESETTIKWGLSFGIHRFQGYFVDRLVQAMSAKKKPKA